MSRWRSGSYRLLLGAVMLWVFLVFLPPILHHSGWLTGESLVRSVFRSICHQLPERSFSMMGAPLGVCARCLGLYLGFLAGVLILPRFGRLSRALEERPRLLVLFVIPMACDLLFWENTHWSRLVTGFAAAFPVALFVCFAVEQLPASRFLRSSQ